MFKSYRLTRTWVLFVFIAGILLFFGCDNSPQTTADQSANMGTPDCLLCGEWETPEGARLKWHLFLSPDKVELSSQSILGIDVNFCTTISQNFKITGEYKGQILLDDYTIQCNNGGIRKNKNKQTDYLLRKYTLLLSIFNRKVLFVRAGVEIPKQKNPLLGKWMPFRLGRKNEVYKDLWSTASTKIWFKKDLSVSPMTSRKIKQYIVEEDRVIVIYENGSWLFAEMSGQDSILLNSNFIKELDFEDRLVKFVRVE